MYDDILIPTDGSSPADTAVQTGIEIAAESDATVHALYVVEPIPLGRFAAGARSATEEWGDVIEAQRAEGENATAAVAEVAAEHGLEVAQAVRHGKPADQILAYVEDEGVDTIVMGTHGRTGADRLVIGSVAEQVVRRSPVPVMTVRDGL